MYMWPHDHMYMWQHVQVSKCACLCMCICILRWAKWSYLCPSSWAMVKESGRPVSSLMLQLRCGWHMPATWDRPRVSQGLLMAAQMSFLSVGKKVQRMKKGQKQDRWQKMIENKKWWWTKEDVGHQKIIIIMIMIINCIYNGSFLHSRFYSTVKITVIKHNTKQ